MDFDISYIFCCWFPGVPGFLELSLILNFGFLFLFFCALLLVYTLCTWVAPLHFC